MSTWTSRSENLFIEAYKLIKVIHNKCVGFLGPRGHLVQLSRVSQSYSYGVDMDSFSSGPLRFWYGVPTIDVRHPVGDDNADVLDIFAVAILSREHFRPHGFEASSSVRTTVLVRDFVHSPHVGTSAVVFVQLEHNRHPRAVDDHTDSDCAAVEIYVLQKILDEVLHFDKVGVRDAGRRIQDYDQVHSVQ